MRKPLSLFCVLMLAVAAAGCSGSSDSGSSSGATTSTTASSKTSTTKAGGSSGSKTSDISKAEATDAFVSNLSEGSEDAGQLVIPKDADTGVAPKFVKTITVATIRENGVTAADIAKPGFDGAELGLTEDQGQELVDAFGACDVDIYQLFIEALTAGLTAEQQSCSRENLDKDLANALLVKTFSTGQSDKEFEAVVKDLTDKCDLPPA